MEEEVVRSLASALQAGGHRLTRQRRVVLEVLEESHEHLDAEALYERARQRTSRISLATVYRTVAVLKQMGLITEHSLGEEHGHFETVREVPHYHFTCLGCGAVVEFDAPQVEEILQELAEREGLEVCGVQFALIGYCAHCRTGGGDAQ
ncbi:MAG: transcriptional repressor [Anaerolineae bacterium]|nr:transcriptional repressor [Anaerolineae bacterium]MDW8068392.1 transcriptional repressor [Anaerolineae bacterium]